MRSTRCASSIYLTLAILLSTVVAQQSYTVAPASNGSSVQDILRATNQTLTWSKAAGSSASAIVAPLRGQNNDFPRVPVSILYPYGASDNFLSVNSSTIAFISCDATDYPKTGNIGPISVYTMAAQNNAAAILLYSHNATACNVSGDGIPAYDRVWTLTSSMDVDRVVTDDATSPSVVIATIGTALADGLDYTAYSNLTMPSTVAQPAPSRGGNLNTQVAMIILYTVTGIVTGLFLIIIITGAVRAHRHPERYGPRRLILGRPRQTRAGGLARAMLDSLPIVKFGNSDDKDIELQNANAAAQLSDGGHSTTSQPSKAEATSSSPVDHSREADTASNRSGIGPAEPRPAPITSDATTSEGHPTSDPASSTPAAAAAAVTSSNSLGCSICTEDFEQGQDVRVLPCDHRFHPACVDPWLLNVSGTCPLCRIELAPRRGSQDATNDGSTTADNTTSANGDLPPPLEMGGQGASAERSTGLRRSFFSHMGSSTLGQVSGAAAASMSISAATGRAYGQPPQGPSPRDADFMLEALRRWRESQQRRRNRGSVVSTGSAGLEGAVEQERRRRNRFSRVFGIRTRREGGGESVVQSPEVVQEGFTEREEGQAAVPEIAAGTDAVPEVVREVQSEPVVEPGTSNPNGSSERQHVVDDQARPEVAAQEAAPHTSSTGQHKSSVQSNRPAKGEHASGS